MYYLIELHLRNYLCVIFIVVNVVIDKENDLNEIWTMIKRWNGRSCTKLALNPSWTYGLITLSVRVFELNYVVMGSNLY